MHILSLHKRTIMQFQTKPTAQYEIVNVKSYAYVKPKQLLQNMAIPSGQ